MLFGLLSEDKVEDPFEGGDEKDKEECRRILAELKMINCKVVNEPSGLSAHLARLEREGRGM